MNVRITGHRLRETWEATGLSLIELLGVIAVMTVLALGVGHVLLRHIVEADRQNEIRTLERLSEGLTRHILRSHTIPGATDFAFAVAAELGLDQASVLYNRANRLRVYLIHPGLSVGPGGGGLPYNQTWQGSTNEPANMRVMIISSLSEPLPSHLASGSAASVQQFDELWNLGDRQMPSTWAGWTGDPSLLIIRRINLGVLFDRVTLENKSTTEALFDVDGQQARLLGNGRHTAWYLEGTRLRLRCADGTESIEVIKDERTFIYEGGVWKGSSYANLASPNRNIRPDDVQAAYDRFMASPGNPNARVTKSQVTQAMEYYMSNYVQWAVGNFSDRRLESQVKQAALDLERVCTDYLFKAGK